MRKRLVFLSTIIIAVAAFTLVWVGLSPVAEASGSKTGVGLSEHVLKAYSQGWKYQPACYGQFVNGVRSSDCSGLIKSYLWWTGESTNPRPGLMSVAGSSSGMLSSASSKGKINYSNSSSLPRIHGLILYQPGHVGVYVGNNMAVDNRATGINMKYEKVFGRNTPKWTMWLKLPQITYPTTGLVNFNGSQYYYENGQYVVNTTRTINGKTYTFGSSGASTSSTSGGTVQTPPASTKTAVTTATKTHTTKAKPAGAVSYSTLSVNMKNEEVKKLQQRLKDLGYYYESINTYYDLIVADAVRDYQTTAKLNSTGKADSATLTSLYSSSAPENPDPGRLAPGIHTSLVKKMQARLMELGYMTGDLSITYGESTKQAVLLYQKAAGLTETGIMEAEELDQLYSDSAVKASAVSSAPTSSTGTVSSSIVSQEQKVSVYDDMVPKANAATFDKTQPTQDSTLGFALFFVLASGFLTGIIMLIKKFKKNGVRNPFVFLRNLPKMKSPLHYLKK